MILNIFAVNAANNIDILDEQYFFKQGEMMLTKRNFLKINGRVRSGTPKPVNFLIVYWWKQLVGTFNDF